MSPSETPTTSSSTASPSTASLSATSLSAASVDVSGSVASAALALLAQVLVVYAEATEAYGDALGSDGTEDVYPVHKWSLERSDLAVWNNGYAAGMAGAVRRLLQVVAGSDLDEVVADLLDSVAQIEAETAELAPAG